MLCMYCWILGRYFMLPRRGEKKASSSNLKNLYRAEYLEHSATLNVFHDKKKSFKEKKNTSIWVCDSRAVLFNRNEKATSLNLYHFLIFLFKLMKLTQKVGSCIYYGVHYDAKRRQWQPEHVSKVPNCRHTQSKVGYTRATTQMYPFHILSFHILWQFNQWVA